MGRAGGVGCCAEWGDGMNATFIRIDRELVLRITNGAVTVHDIKVTPSSAALLVAQGASFLCDEVQKLEREKPQ